MSIAPFPHIPLLLPNVRVQQHDLARPLERIIICGGKVSQYMDLSCI